MIITSRDKIKKDSILVCTSIGGSPLHPGHIRLIRDCRTKTLEHQYNVYADTSLCESWIEYFQTKIELLVIVNCDDFLLRKHNFVFQNENDRAEIIDSIKGVDYTYIHQSNEQSVVDALLYFKPDYFCKGGDRSGPQYMPQHELDACKELECEIIYGVGGTDKVSSSSELMKSCARHYLFEEYVDDWMSQKDMEMFAYYFPDFPKWKNKSQMSDEERRGWDNFKPGDMK